MSWYMETRPEKELDLLRWVGEEVWAEAPPNSGLNMDRLPHERLWVLVGTEWYLFDNKSSLALHYRTRLVFVEEMGGGFDIAVELPLQHNGWRGAPMTMSGARHRGPIPFRTGMGGMWVDKIIIREHPHHLAKPIGPKPHQCPACGSAALVLFTTIECTKLGCRHFNLGQKEMPF